MKIVTVNLYGNHGVILMELHQHRKLILSLWNAEHSKLS